MKDGDNKRRQGIFWILTIPKTEWTPPTELPDYATYIGGQAERGGETGYEHWQLLVAFSRKQSLNGCRKYFHAAHCELSRSSAANAYVFKDDTRIAGTQFSLGTLPINRSCKIDWEMVWQRSKRGEVEEIPASIRIQSYSAIRRISADYGTALPMERTCVVYCGPTGTGKSHRAWNEAGNDAYSKNPRTKWWDGYIDQKFVILDEFRGGIDIAHILRWLDKYPVFVETKGSSRPLSAVKFWITSNLHPLSWYPEIDHETYKALERRLEIVWMDIPYVPPEINDNL